MIFNNEVVTDLTDAIEKVPAKPSLIGSLGLFGSEMTAQDSVQFDVKANSLTVLDDSLRNTAQKNAAPESGFDVHVLPLPHYSQSAVVSRQKLAGIRGFNSSTERMVAEAVAEEVERQAERLTLQHEYLMALTLLQGQVDTNAHGLISMSDELGVTRPSVELTDAEGQVLAGLREAQRASKEGMNGTGRSGGFVLLCGDAMFERLIMTADLQRSYELGMSGSGSPLMNQLGEVGTGYSAFRWGNVDVINYSDTFTRADGSAVTVLADDAAVLVPRTRIGVGYFGPESTLQGLNRGGAKRFARQFTDPKGRFIEVESETNSLFVVHEYGSIVDVSFATAA